MIGYRCLFLPKIKYQAPELAVFLEKQLKGYRPVTIV